MTVPQLTRRRLLTLGAVAAGATWMSPSIGWASPASAATSGYRIRSADQAARRVYELSAESVRLGSRGVGGLIVDNRSGRVIREGRNYHSLPVNPEVATAPGQVFTWDYTAHGETGLVGWYLDNRKQLGLPDPGDLTIITSLDPCAMCTGSIITAGFNAAVVAYDPTGGMNVSQDGRYRSLTPGLRGRALDSFGFYAVQGEREYFGAAQIPFRDTFVSEESAAACRDVFFTPSSVESLDNVVPLPQVVNPATLSPQHPLRVAMAREWPDSFSVMVAEPTKPSRDLKVYLEKLVSSVPGATNAVAFVDMFGNLITAKADAPGRVPFHTAFMNTTQSYARTRYKLFNDPITHEGANDSLTSPVNGSFIWLYAPNPGTASTLKDLGAFGATMGHRAPGGFQFFEEPRIGSYGDLLEQIALLPPFYTQSVDISPLPVGVYSAMPI